jgi:hypothetical protein
MVYGTDKYMWNEATLAYLQLLTKDLPEQTGNYYKYAE